MTKTREEGEINFEEEDKIYDEYAYEFNPLKKEAQYKTPAGNSVLLSFLKNFKVGMDLSKISAPISFNNGLSSLEQQADALRPSSYLEAFFREGDAAKRMLLLLLHKIHQFSGFPSFRMEGSKGYNPILGEQCFAKWDLEDGSMSELIMEQVSHHPPVCCYYVENSENNFVSEGTYATSVIFRGNSVDLWHKGYRQLTHVNPESQKKETYYLTGPAAVCKGIFFGELKLGANGKLVVTCPETNTLGMITFDVHSLKLKVKQKKTPNSKTHELKVYRGEGSTLKTISIHNLLTKEKKEMYNLATNKIYRKRRVPLRTMSSIESRRVWHLVTYAHRKIDEDTAQAEKHKLEEHQRQLRKERAKKKEPFVPTLFEESKEKAPNGEQPYYLITEAGKQLFEKVNEDVDDLD